MTLVLKQIKEHFPFDYHTISGEELDISSTQIRSLILNNRNLSEHLPENVIQFIQKESVY
jgi:nicotinic acid mononucleotide adenylyltransferase